LTPAIILNRSDGPVGRASQCRPMPCAACPDWLGVADALRNRLDGTDGWSRWTIALGLQGPARCEDKLKELFVEATGVDRVRGRRSSRRVYQAGAAFTDGLGADVAPAPGPVLSVNERLAQQFVKPLHDQARRDVGPRRRRRKTRSRYEPPAVGYRQPCELCTKAGAVITTPASLSN